ncbi:MAG: hypothetical protein RJQ10_11530 [Haliea sp.]|uniref:hypothetical protein n=1 Tax=Haliea sp. TaxID=1932666 RepID=UPI0032ED876F
MNHCSECGQPLPTDPVEAEAETIRSWCRDNGVVLVLGDAIHQSAAARYLGLSQKTLQNCYFLPSKRIRRRVYVRIGDIAEFICNQISR